MRCPLFFLLLLFTACETTPNKESKPLEEVLEKRVFIAEPEIDLKEGTIHQANNDGEYQFEITSDFHFDKNGLADTTNRKLKVRYFSRAFWLYMAKKYPPETYGLFHVELIIPKGVITTRDSTLLGNGLGFSNTYLLLHTLPSAAGMASNAPLMSFEVFSDSGAHAELSQKLDTPVLTDRVKRDFQEFRKILADRKGKPVLLYRKSFVRELDSLYQ
jgi:hypothetical protein